MEKLPKPSPYFEENIPLGTYLEGDKVKATAYSSSASSVVLQLFDPSNERLAKEIPLEKENGGFWHTELKVIDPEMPYLYLIDGKCALDPYAKLLASPYQWGKWEKPLRCHFTWDHSFDWQKTPKPITKQQELIIYEMHIRGFSGDVSSKVKHPGTFLGVIEKIPYLKSLGVNAIELMPMFEFDEKGHIGHQDNHWNYWGYSSINFFSPMRRFAAKNSRLAPLEEFKLMVRELHKAGISVILDVVYNHVDSQSNLDLWDRRSYFILDQFLGHTNYTGCGNTISANHPLTTQLILSSLAYFADECKVDGFRFDLAAAMTRGKKGEYLFSPPIFKTIENDPSLSNTHLVGEPWDCSTLHLQGKFPCSKLSEWNAFFRDDVRKFIRGDPFVEKTYLEHLLGISYIVKERGSPDKMVNYVASHDGFSAEDLVSYNQKHNEPNGEDNRDGEAHILSCNYGVEGKTKDPNILQLRKQQRENLLFSAIFCRGITMLKMGDEYGHSHEGNNNPYCLDSKINWLDWEKMGANYSSVSLVSNWLKTKKQHPFFSDTKMLQESEIQWVLHEDRFAVCIAKNSYLFVINMNAENRSLPIDPLGWNIIATTGPYNTMPKEILPRTALIACQNFINSN